MKLFVNGYGSPMHGWDWFVCGEVRNTKKEAAQDLRELKQKLKQLDELQKQLTDARNALLREGMQRDVLLDAVTRCYKMLLSEPDTRGAWFKAENILREAIADTKGAV